MALTVSFVVESATDACKGEKAAQRGIQDGLVHRHWPATKTGTAGVERRKLGGCQKIAGHTHILYLGRYIVTIFRRQTRTQCRTLSSPHASLVTAW